MYRIINNSPVLEDNIYCYKGVCNHYITRELPIDTEYILQYKFTLIFDVAQKFYNNYQITDNSCIYRTTIKKGSKALFIDPISFIPQEMEILIPNNSLVIKNNKEIEDYYNNIKYSICSAPNKFKSIDIIIYNNLPPYLLPDLPQITTDISNFSNFSIVTANINGLLSCNSDDKIHKLIKYKPNIVCIQESHKKFQLFMKENGYNLSITNIKFNESNQ
jgi:hypothetical protein